MKQKYMNGLLFCNTISAQEYTFLITIFQQKLTLYEFLLPTFVSVTGYYSRYFGSHHFPFLSLCGECNEIIFHFVLISPGRISFFSASKVVIEWRMWFPGNYEVWSQIRKDWQRKDSKWGQNVILWLSLI